jgi:hypothetical protein
MKRNLGIIFEDPGEYEDRFGYWLAMDVAKIHQ